MPWVRLATWSDMRAREERVAALLEQWDSDIAAARSDPCKSRARLRCSAHAQLRFAKRSIWGCDDED